MDTKDRLQYNAGELTANLIALRAIIETLPDSIQLKRRIASDIQAEIDAAMNNPQLTESYLDGLRLWHKWIQADPLRREPIQDSAIQAQQALDRLAKTVAKGGKGRP